MRSSRLAGPGAPEVDFEALAFLERSRDVADERVGGAQPDTPTDSGDSAVLQPNGGVPSLDGQDR